MKKIKKILSLILSIIILSSAFPTLVFNITASADTSGYYTYTVENGEATITVCDTAISGDVEIPSTLGGYPVTSIGDSAFSRCYSITSVIIPNGVTIIGDSAFEYCTKMISIIIPDSVTDIGDSAFLYCYSMTDITIPDGVTNIVKFTFYGCNALTTINIPDGVTSIGRYAFYWCGLTSINIPSSVTFIGDSAFENCSDLKNVYITDLVAWCNISFDYASNPMWYADNLYLNNVLLTEVNIPDGVTSIGTFTFYGCSLINSITIPSSVKSIGSNTFFGCSSLKSITIPNSVTSIGYGAFNRCTSLTNITIPDSVVSIGNTAFWGCSSLTSIIIPDGITEIGSSTFSSCSSLTSITIPKSVTSIGNSAFLGCSEMKNVYYEGTAEEWAEITIYSANDCLINANIIYDSPSIPSGITSVEISKLPDKVQYIENKENLDLTGGVLTVYYDGGATQDIDLATLNVEGFNNSILGKQTITVKYGEFSTEFEVEIIVRPMTFVAVSNLPDKTEYKIGENLDLTGGKIVVGYPEGNYEFFDITADMVSGFDNTKSGLQILTVTYKGFTQYIFVTVLVNPDLDSDGKLTISDAVNLRNEFLNSDILSDMKYDINGDGKIDARDIVNLKKQIAENNGL